MTDNDMTPSAGGSSATGCQFSIYPLHQDDIDGPIQAAIAAASRAGVSVRVGNLSTLLVGAEEPVFAALKAAFGAACAYGPTVMAATLTTGVPTDELVAEIQRQVGRADLAGGPAQRTGEPAPRSGGHAQQCGGAHVQR